ncbi:ComEC/Rec2 family competence protein [Candidatus Berkelbacteria bacterium]|nr:ComEC/Rec2 family competence protein [Candidatus Berkelbacteria bacterium]
MEDWLLPSLFLILTAVFLALSLLLIGRFEWQTFAIVIGLVGVGSLVASWHWLRLPKATEQSGEFEVRVKSSPVSKLSGQLVYVDLPDRTRLRATFPQQDSINYGDVYLVDGDIQLPRSDVNFNEKGFLLAHGATGRIVIRDAELIGQNQGNIILVQLHHFKVWLSRRLVRIFGDPEQQLIAGVLLGDNSNISDKLEEIFRLTGTSHVLVASGSNVLIIAWVALAGLAFLGKKRASVLALTLVAAFTVISGADASIIRAAVFYVFIAGAVVFGRRVHGPTIIALVALMMSVINPWLILYDVAFQLSFAAVIGLMVFSEWFLLVFKKLPFSQIIALTLAAQLTTLPVLIFHFGQVSLISPLANLVVTPLIPILMAGAAASLILPWVLILPWLTEGLAVVVIRLVDKLSQVGWASQSLPVHHLGWTGGVLILIGIIYLLKKHAQKTT